MASSSGSRHKCCRASARSWFQISLSDWRARYECHSRFSLASSRFTVVSASLGAGLLAQDFWIKGLLNGGFLIKRPLEQRRFNPLGHKSFSVLEFLAFASPFHKCAQGEVCFGQARTSGTSLSEDNETVPLSRARAPARCFLELGLCFIDLGTSVGRLWAALQRMAQAHFEGGPRHATHSH